MAGRILIARVEADRQAALAATLSAGRYEVIEVATPDAALAEARTGLVDLVLIDEGIDASCGTDLCRAIKADPLAHDLPVILMSELDDTAARHLALESGADELLRNPHDEVVLMARVRSILRLRDTSEELRRRRTTASELGFAEAAGTFAPPGRITFITDPADGAEWIGRLKPLLRHRMQVATPEAALDGDFSGRAADAYVIEAGAERMTKALRLISDLRSRPHSRHAAILVVCPRGDGDCGAMALDLGANDLVPSDFDAPELALRLRTQLRRKREADLLRAAVDEDLRLAAIDPLTGLYNRRYAMAHLAKISSRSAQTGRTFALMVADLDRFKSINDRYGHGGGDAVLVETARRLKDNLRGADLVARIGGEEFLIAMPDTDLEEAGMAAQRLCHVIDQEPVTLPGGQSAHVTLSIGVSIGGGVQGVDMVAALLEKADRALYDFKSEGRNQVTISSAA